MRSFLTRLFYFSFPLAVLLGCAFFLPVERKFAYCYNPGDCENRGAWLYQRIFQDTTPVDIAFFGTSHTITGIDESAIEKLVREKNGKTEHVVNFGYCRVGEEVPYVIAKDLFKTKKPHLVVIEVRERISFSSHPLYPYLAETGDLLSPPSRKNVSYIPNLYTSWLVHVKSFRSSLIPGSETCSCSEINGEHGFRPTNEKADSAALAQIKPVSTATTLFRDAQLDYPLAWQTKLVELAEQHGAKVIFLYLPSFGNHPPKSEVCSRFFPTYTELIPPDSIFSNTANWRDPDHMNSPGGASLSAWIATQLPAN